VLEWMTGKERLGRGGAPARRNMRSRGRSAGHRFRGWRANGFHCLWGKRETRKNIGKDKSRSDLTNSTN